MSTCPHCGGDLTVILNADLVDDVVRRRDHLLDALADHNAAVTRLIEEGLEVGDPHTLRPADPPA